MTIGHDCILEIAGLKFGPPLLPKKKDPIEFHLNGLNHPALSSSHSLLASILMDPNSNSLKDSYSIC